MYFSAGVALHPNSDNTHPTLSMLAAAIATSVVVVPASGVIVVEDLRRGPGLQQVVHLVLLPPGQRLTQELPGLVHVEVPGPQEAQDMLVLRDLDKRVKES